MPQMFAHIPHNAVLAFPGDAAAPLDCQTQAEPLGVAHLYRRPPGGGHTRGDVALVQIVHDDVQCDQEGFEIEVHGHVSWGERVDMAVDSRQNFPLLSRALGSICIKRLTHPSGPPSVLPGFRSHGKWHCGATESQSSARLFGSDPGSHCHRVPPYAAPPSSLVLWQHAAPCCAGYRPAYTPLRRWPLPMDSAIASRPSG